MPSVPASPRAGVSAVPFSSEKRWRRAVVRFLRHLVRINALRAFAAAVVALGVVELAGADTAVGQGGLVVIGTLISFILLPDEPSRFWRVRAEDLAETVPPSDLQAAGRATARALALQSGGLVGAEPSATLWDDAVARVGRGLGDPQRIVMDMDYRISVGRDGGRQLVRATVTSKRCWPANERVFFSFCSDVNALSREFALSDAGSISREIVEVAPGESLDAWDRRVSTYPVSLVIDGANLEPISRETRRFDGRSMAHRVVFDVGESVIRERFTPMRLTSEFHQMADDRAYTVKFATYFCVGATQLSLEVDDATAEIDTNDFLQASGAETHFFHQFGLASHRVTLQTGSGAVLHPGSGVVFSWRPGPLLAPIPASLDEWLEAGEPLPVHPGPPSAPVPCEERDEPLVPIDGVRCLDAYYRIGVIDSPRELVAREEVVRRLGVAQAKLPPGFGLVVLDAWRSLDLQTRLVELYRDMYPDGVDGYVADPSSQVMRPPHVVGGALDLTLSYGGRPLALGSAYDEFSDAAHLDAYEGTDSPVRRLRRLLARVLLDAGFAPYPQEWWHWSYGDDMWATYVGRSALYGLAGDKDS